VINRPPVSITISHRIVAASVAARVDSWSLTCLEQRLVKTGGALIKRAPYLLTPASGELSDALALWKHAAQERDPAIDHGIGLRARWSRFR
jgi:hypothetical protein